MAVLTIQWETLDRIPSLVAPVVTSEDEVSAPAPEAAAPKSHDKPYLVYVADPAATTGFDTVEKVILTDDRVTIASHAFHMVKMSPEQAKEDPVLKEKGGKQLPRIILVTADMKTVKPLEGGTLKLGEVWNLMKATANKHYTKDLDATVKALKDVLVEYDKVNAERKVLEEKENRAKKDDKPNPTDEKEIAAKRAELDARQKKAEEKEKALFDLKVKGEKAA
jgi:hypothetical protein